MTRPSLALPVLSFFWGLACCNRTPAPPPLSTVAPVSAIAAEPPAPSPPAPPHAPMTLAELPTTDGLITKNNFNASLKSAEAFALTRPGDLALRGRIIEMLCARGQYFGVLADYDRGAQIAEQMAKAAPNSPFTLLAQARMHSVFHEFEPALKELEQTARLDLDARRTASETRLPVLVAMGQLDEALRILHDMNEKHPEIMNEGLEASLLGERGELAAADDLFIKAQQHFHDVSPFPVVWLYFQHGLLWERVGNLARARELYAAAVERLPGYAPAVAHLAAAEAARTLRDRAIALLRPLVTDSDDPEYKGQLSQLLKEAGELKEAEALRVQARKDYEALLARHPRAFASHAVRFYLGAGADPQAAHLWAEKNLAALTTNDSLALAAEAATASGKAARACEVADLLSKRPYQSALSHVAASRAYTACGQKERAAAEAAAAAKPRSP